MEALGLGVGFSTGFLDLIRMIACLFRYGGIMASTIDMAVGRSNDLTPNLAS
jgi:hypothetical protein